MSVEVLKRRLPDVVWKKNTVVSKRMFQQIHQVNGLIIESEPRGSSSFSCKGPICTTKTQDGLVQFDEKIIKGEQITRKSRVVKRKSSGLCFSFYYDKQKQLQEESTTVSSTNTITTTTKNSSEDYLKIKHTNSTNNNDNNKRSSHRISFAKDLQSRQGSSSSESSRTVSNHNSPISSSIIRDDGSSRSNSTCVAIVPDKTCNTTKRKTLRSVSSARSILDISRSSSSKSSSRLSSSKPRSNSESSLCTTQVSLPFATLHSLHVNSDFVWSSSSNKELFTIINKIGSGQSSTVFQAIQHSNGMKFAIKQNRRCSMDR